MDYRLYQRLVYLIICAFFLSTVTVHAETSTSPASAGMIEKAEQSMQSASEAGADSLAAQNFQLAAEALNQARQLALKRKTKEADRFALKSIRYAELSANEAQYLQLSERLENKTAENSRLRRELLLGTAADKP